jgi:transmembrane sensor
MSVGRPAGGDDREGEAIAWLVRLSSGDAGVEEWRAHEAWLAADPANLTAFDRIEALWSDLDDQADALKRDMFGEGAGAAVIPLRPARRPRRAFGLARIAAAAAVVLAGGGGLYAWLQSQPLTYKTAPGEIRRIDLADGTRIDLNGASRMSVRIDRTSRRVAMTGAEALFDVTSDPARPFLITAGGQRIRVVGTAFDVASHDGRLSVSVRRGVVEVGRTDASGGVADVARVPAGFQLVRADGDAAAEIRPIDPSEAGAWRQRRLIYHGQPLETVASDLSRAFAVPIAVRGPARKLTFTGVLVLDDEDAVIRRLQAFVPIDVDRSSAAIVLSSRP